jgi:hypothetical protein
MLIHTETVQKADFTVIEGVSMTFRTIAAATLGILVSVPAWAGSMPASAGTTPAASFGQAKPVNVVILADESGSMGYFPNELTGEQQAAIDIIEAAWSPDSRVAVYGFGSAPPVRGVSASLAVTQLCPLTELNSRSDIQSLARCADEIAVRTKPGEDNTDFAAALKEAEGVLSPPDPSRVSLVFMLTDGMLDVAADSPYAPYPSTATQGYNAAQQLITGTILPSLKNAGIEVWPVGFGQADKGELSLFAGGGAQVNPDCPADTGATPRLTAVPSTVSGAAETQDIQQDLLTAFAAATCGTTGPPSWQVLGPGQSVTKDVAIDPLTTFGSIVVNKGSPQIQVTYTDPDGGQVPDSTPSSGFLHGAAYSMTGGGPQLSQEALLLDNPVPGTWQVRFYNPLKVPQTVGVSLVWQGQVTPAVAFSPQVGVSGQLMRIEVTPAMNARPIPASELARLTVSIGVQWIPDGAVVQVPATLDQATGEFTGTVRVPGGQGHATVTATVAEPGVQGTVPAEVSYDPTGGMNVALSFPRGRVSPGGSLTETATVDNVGQPATSLEFLLAGLGGGAVASITPDHPVAIGSGRTTVPVTIRFGTRTGEVAGTVQYEATGSGVPVTAAFLDVNVEPQPATPWWVWALTGIGAAALAVLLWWWLRRRRRDRRDVQHVGIGLNRPGGPAEVPLVQWPGGYTEVRWFGVSRTGATGTPQLRETTESGAGLLELRRDPSDRQLTLTVHVARSPSRPAPGPPSGPAPEPVKLPTGRWFEPPAGAGLDGCKLMLEERPRKRDEAHPPRGSVPAPAGGNASDGGKLQRRQAETIRVGKKPAGQQKDANGQQEGA